MASLSKNDLKNYLYILIGSIIMAVGYVFFITPYKIVPGGIYGFGIIVYHLTKEMWGTGMGFPIGIFGFIVNIPLFFIGLKYLGKRFGIGTLIGFVLSSIFIDLFTYLWGDLPLVENDALLSSIFGGILAGVGLGMIFKAKATTGGTDIIVMLLAKWTKHPIGFLFIIVDAVIVLFALLAFGDWKIPLYSWINIYITGKVIDYILEGANYSRTVLIISDKYDEIKEKILFQLNRGATWIKAEGMYTGTERKLIFTNVSRRELSILRDYIHNIDPKAFVTVISTSEIYGEGFKKLSDEE